MRRSRQRRKLVLFATLVVVPLVAYQVYKYQRHLLFINPGTPIVHSVLLEAPGIVLMTDDLYNVALVIRTTDRKPGVSVNRDSTSAEITIISDPVSIIDSKPIRVSAPADSNTLIIVGPDGSAHRRPLPKGASATIRKTYLSDPNNFQHWLNTSPLATGP